MWTKKGYYWFWHTAISLSFITNIWVCLKDRVPPIPWIIMDNHHIPYYGHFYWGYTNHFQTHPYYHHWISQHWAMMPYSLRFVSIPQRSTARSIAPPAQMAATAKFFSDSFATAPRCKATSKKSGIYRICMSCKMQIHLELHGDRILTIQNHIGNVGIRSI